MTATPTSPIALPDAGPYPLTQVPPSGGRRSCSAAESLLDLMVIQLARVRGAWPWIFLVSSATPIGLVFFLSYVSADSHRATVLQYITGTIVIGLMVTPLFMLAGQFAWARQSKAFDFYAGLPISRTALILAAVSVAVLFTIPGTLFLLVLGMLVYHLWLVPHPLTVLIVLLSPLALCGVGAAIGVLAPSQDIAGVTCNLLTVVITFLSPVFVPISKLPGVLQISARLLPPSYASDALRQTLGGHLTGSVILDVSVLAAFSVAGIYLATARLDWRSR